MKYILTKREQFKQACVLYQLGQFIVLSFKFLKLVGKTPS